MVVSGENPRSQPRLRITFTTANITDLEASNSTNGIRSQRNPISTYRTKAQFADRVGNRSIARVADGCCQPVPPLDFHADFDAVVAGSFPVCVSKPDSNLVWQLKSICLRATLFSPKIGFDERHKITLVLSFIVQRRGDFVVHSDHQAGDHESGLEKLGKTAPRFWDVDENTEKDPRPWYIPFLVAMEM